MFLPSVVRPSENNLESSMIDAGACQVGSHSSGRGLSFAPMLPSPASTGETANGKVGFPVADDSCLFVVADAKSTVPSIVNMQLQILPLAEASNPFVMFTPPVASASKKPMFADDSRNWVSPYSALAIKRFARGVGSSEFASIRSSK